MFEDAESVLNMTRELSGDQTRVEAVHIDPSALEPMDNAMSHDQFRPIRGQN